MVNSFKLESIVLRFRIDLEAQSLLGVEGFAEGLRHLVAEKAGRSERYRKGKDSWRGLAWKRLFSEQKPRQSIAGPTHCKSYYRLRV